MLTDAEKNFITSLKSMEIDKTMMKDKNFGSQ